VTLREKPDFLNVSSRQWMELVWTAGLTVGTDCQSSQSCHFVFLAFNSPERQGYPQKGTDTVI